MSDNGFRFGDWQIDPDSNTLRNEGATATVEPKAMDVLRYLCRHPGAVIPPEELLQACWGNAELGDNPIHKAITQLRRALGDSASEPRYIETVRKRGYRAIAPVIATEDALEGSWQQGSPFRGLESFQESHAAIFFGRMQATAQLRELVLKQASDGCAMALVLGPSGSGKTSLVRAGLLPGLMASRTGSGEPVALACTLYMDCADLADGNLFQALAAVLMDAEVGGKLLFAGENAEGLGRWLESSDAQAIAGRLAEASGRIKIGLFVDRLEAIFRAPGVTDEIRARFIAVLEHLALSKAVLVMLACRNDFYPEVIALPALMALKSRGGHFDLNPPDGAEIAQMVRMPAKAAGLKFEVDPATGAALDDVLCDAARASPDTLPLLQYCLNELYRQRGEDGTLGFDKFRLLGGIEGAIAVRAEQVVAGVSANQAAALPIVLSLIVDVAEEQGAVTARRAAWAGLPNTEAQELVQSLVEARLFVSELSGNVPSFGMAHEALLRRWPRVSEWIEQHRHALQLRTRISHDADKWASAGKPRDLLLPGGIRVKQASRLLEITGFSLSSLEREYINNSQDRAKFSERLRIIAFALIGTLAVLASVLGFTALRSQKTADLRRSEAENLMTYMLGDFVEKLRPLGKLDLLDNISARALPYLSDNNALDTSHIGLLQRAKSLQIIAEVKRSQGHMEEAITALAAGRNILQRMDKPDIKDRDLVKNLGANAFWLGQTYLDRSDFDKAEQYFLDYKKYSDRFSKLEPDDVEGWIEQSYAYTNLGSIALKRGDLHSASSSFFAASELKLRAFSKHPNNLKYSADLANSHSFLASTKVKLGELREGMTLFQQEEKILRQLLAKTEDAKITYRLAGSISRQAELLSALGKPLESHARLIEAEHLLKNLVLLDPSNRYWQLYMYSLQLKIFESETENIEYKNNLDRINKLHEKVSALGKLDPKRTEVHDLTAKLLWAKGLVYLKNNNRNESLTAIDQSIEILEGLHKNDSRNQSIIISLANATLALSEFERISGQTSNSQTTCKRAQELLLPLSQGAADYRVLAPLIRAYRCTGEISKISEHLRTLQRIEYRDPQIITPPPA
ncbi:transcriptional regulator [Duganella sp. FT92W]|uniref:Transcriptional regulator n=1 Tax=Pseudoduganella rivuli TaxID=2666085 RepID=A0A7X2LV92_9BURK|nr:winged helix-turn-helix domain-containing protein [Pseudoduganella rivuli]MRV74748.1 transcriptional regulator [Pseudoduganella rivuli]